MNLAEEYIRFERAAVPEATVDDFFDHCGVSECCRSDFIFTAILKQVLELEKAVQNGAYSI